MIVLPHPITLTLTLRVPVSVFTTVCTGICLVYECTCPLYMNVSHRCFYCRRACRTKNNDSRFSVPCRMDFGCLELMAVRACQYTSLAEVRQLLHCERRPRVPTKTNSSRCLSLSVSRECEYRRRLGRERGHLREAITGSSESVVGTALDEDGYEPFRFAGTHRT